MLIPDWSQINKFPIPLNPAERMVIEKYEQLGEQCELDGYTLNTYVQPYLENYQPSVVVGMPGNGILIIEVKDWTTDSKISPKQILAAQQKTEFYRKAILGLCAPNIESILASEGLIDYENDAKNLLLKSVRTAVAVPFLNRAERRKIFETSFVHIIDSEEIKSSTTLIRPTKLPRGRIPRETRSKIIDFLWSSLSSWLTPPYHRAEQGILSARNLTQAQRTHAVIRGQGWYRLAGPAGSGKSLVIANKAALLAAEGKRVLILCFNISLQRYLRDLIDAMQYNFDWEQIAIRHFHGLLKEIRLTFEVCFTPEEIEAIPTDYFIGSFYPNLIDEMLEAHPHHPFKFDAILIDEGQDFPVNWIKVLTHCIDEDGELLLVRDQYQNVYRKDISWADSGDAIRGLKGSQRFFGPWAKLQTTWRMSPIITKAVSEFSHRMFKAPKFETDRNRPNQGEMVFGSTFCRWENISEFELDARLLEVVDTVTKESTPTHPSDYVILTYDNKLAKQVVKNLSRAGQSVIHIYDKAGNRDRKLINSFQKGDGRIKVCTGHNFKGYELWGVILLVTPWSTLDDHAQWIYTSMGRAIESLWVLNMDTELNDVENWFPRL